MLFVRFTATRRATCQTTPQCPRRSPMRSATTEASAIRSPGPGPGTVGSATQDAHDGQTVLLSENLSLRSKLDSGQGGRSPLAVRLRTRERIGSTRRSSRCCAGGVGLRGALRSVGGCRSLSRHAGPFPCMEEAPKSSARPAPRPQQANRGRTYHPQHRLRHGPRRCASRLRQQDDEDDDRAGGFQVRCTYAVLRWEVVAAEYPLKPIRKRSWTIVQPQRWLSSARRASPVRAPSARSRLGPRCFRTGSW